MNRISGPAARRLTGLRVTRLIDVRALLAGLVAALIMLAGIACQGGPDADAPSSDNAAGTVANDPGVSDDRILFGQSAALSGPAQQLGLGMRMGIQAAFHEINAAGGVHGRRLDLTTLNDSYEPDLARANTQRLVQADRVFALIGEVGTPTSRAAVPAAQAAGAPFLAPFTGAEFLRDPKLDNVLNLRASYYQETEEMVARLTSDLGIARIAVFYQNDSFGQAGLDGVRRALARRDLELTAAWHYERNTTGVMDPLLNMIEADPEAVIIIGAYAPAAELVTLARRRVDPVFMSVSFVGSRALAAELGPDGAGIYVTQVVPDPDDARIPVVAAYQRALAAYEPNAPPGFVSLEGYLAGRLAIAGLERCGRAVDRDCFLNSLRGGAPVNLDGFELRYGAADNQGSDVVFLTMIDRSGGYIPTDTLASNAP